MGILSGALGGMGEAMVNIGARNQQASLQRENELALNEQRSSLDTQKQLALEKFREGLRTAPLERFGKKAKEYAVQDVPVEADSVSQLSGRPGMGGILGSGMRGNYEELVARAKNLPEEDRQPYLDQLKNQFDAETQAEQEKVSGKTRKRTSDEALNAAAEDIKVNDPVAYAAYEANIGKPKRDERRLDNLERREDTREKKSDAEIEDRRKRSDWLQTHQQEKLELDREIASQRMERGGADDKDPAPVKTAKWLAANKDNPIMMDAWERANQTKSKDVKGIAADLMSKDPMLSAAEAVTKARELVEASDAPKNGADKPITQAEYAKLPSGAVFTAPDGSKRRKP